MKHDWEFIRLNDHPLGQPVAFYVCKKCDVKANVHIKYTSTMVDILGEEDCKGKEELTSSERIVEHLRTGDE